MGNIFSQKSQSQIRLDVVTFLTSLNNDLINHEKTIISLKESFIKQNNRSENADQADLKGIYSSMVEYAEAIESYVKKITPRIAQIHTKVEQVERSSKEYIFFDTLIKKIEESFNRISQIKTDLYRDLDYFYEDHQAILTA